MTRRDIIILPSLLALLAPVALLAEMGAAVGTIAPPLTLEQSITEGLQNSPDIQREEAVLNESRWRRTETLGSGFLPKLSVGINHYFDVTKYQLSDLFFNGSEVVIPGIFPNNQIALNGTIPIFDGLANIHRLHAATLREDASQLELDRARFELAENIRIAFYRALAAVVLDNVAKEDVKTLEDHLKQVQIQLHGGTATQYDSLRVEVQLSEAHSDAADAQDAMVLTRAKLTQLLGLEQDLRPLQGELPAPDTAKAINLAVSGLPSERTDIRALELRAEAASEAHSAEKAWIIPSISAGGQFSYYDLLLYNNGITDNHKYQTAYNVGVFLTWNLFDGGVSYARSRQADEQRTQTEKKFEASRLQIPYDFSYWKKHYLNNTERYRSKQLDVTRSLESVRLAREEQRAGTRTSTEVLDAELDLFRARAGVVNAQVNAAEALVNLELALGRTL